LKYEDGRLRGVLDLSFTQLNDEDKALDALHQDYGLMLLPSTYERPPAEGMKFTQEIRIVPEAARLVVTVRDKSTGLAGMVDIPLAKYLTKVSKSRD